ncbi:hypothetical protein [Trinickia dinghuensis]|uniref:Uncharacterized protein n=1 Tax=Trinickia dinghuensis TaxID=2291023 RepID=A0A3D8K7J1_9BURK|nr:hypothetical protein [Trinickia dinghuensis]RDV00552.1 hypothetical protein DWV00_01885 [Trinickia dinghuensis]
MVADESVDEALVDAESVDEVDEVDDVEPEVLAVVDASAVPLPCCDAAENRSPRNCWSALLIELDDVLPEVSVADAVEPEHASVLVDDEVEAELEVEAEVAPLDVVSPI